MTFFYECRMCLWIYNDKTNEYTKGVIRSRQKIQCPKEKGQSKFDKTLCSTEQTEQHEPHTKTKVNSGASEG